jgi:hypothetical protein
MCSVSFDLHFTITLILNWFWFLGYTKLPFKWFDYLRETGSIAAPVKLFNKVNLNGSMRFGNVVHW